MIVPVQDQVSVEEVRYSVAGATELGYSWASSSSCNVRTLIRRCCKASFKRLRLGHHPCSTSEHGLEEAAKIILLRSVKPYIRRNAILLIMSVCRNVYMIVRPRVRTAGSKDDQASHTELRDVITEFIRNTTFETMGTSSSPPLAYRLSSLTANCVGKYPSSVNILRFSVHTKL